MTANRHSKSWLQETTVQDRAWICCRLFATLALGLVCARSHAQSELVEIPTEVPLSVQLPQHVPMKKGAELDGRLLYTVYVDNRIAVPAGAGVRGHIVERDANRGLRIHGRLRGDFPPFHIPVVRFDELALPNGEMKPISSDNT